MKDNPGKGRPLTSVAGFVIKEIRYKSFRFYFFTDGHRLKCVDANTLTEQLIRFVRVSDKKHQQSTIDEIKKVLRTIGPAGFD